jgi:anti-sigma regulatory factor (Ser/Thr protein kinase)
MTTVDLLLPPDATAPSRAREGLVSVLPDKEGSESLALGELALSEVVSNAVRHGGTGGSAYIRVVIERDDPAVRVRVIQPGPVPERPTIVNMPGPWSTGGYGLGILDAVADRWGVQVDPPSVWFELFLDEAS